MSDNGMTPRVLTDAERDAVINPRARVTRSAETKQLIDGATLFLPGDYYDRNRSNMSRRALTNGCTAHVRKAVVDGEDGYVVWWERREAAAR